MPDSAGVLKIILVGILGAVVLVSLLSSQDINARALDLTLSTSLLQGGYTELAIPPLGTIRAKTHLFPLRFRIALKDINIDRLKALVSQQPISIFPEIEASFRSQLLAYVVRLLFLALLGGFVLGYLLFRRPSHALLSGLAGLLTFAILICGAVFTYNERAFQEPEFTGVVEAAPWLLGVAEEALLAVESLDDTLRIVAANLTLMFESLSLVGAENAPVEGELKILHVSDVHNNPLGISLASQMAAAFAADLIIDTGDATDYGTPLEGELLRKISDSSLPWIFVPGNHDSPAVISALKELENVTVLEAGIIYLEEFDLTIAGIGDPAAAGTEMRVPSPEEYREAASRLLEIIQQEEKKPALIVSHHREVVEEFSHWPVTLLHGHSHRVDIRTLNKAAIIDAGTTGGAGIRGLMTSEQIPYTMVLLHMHRQGENWQITAADSIAFNQQNAGFILERKRLAAPGPFAAEDGEGPGE